MDKLQSVQALDELFVKLAEILGTTVDAVQANGMEYIMMYGKYKVFSKFLDLPFFIISLLTIIAIVFISVNALDGANKEETKILIKLAVAIIGFITIAMIIGSFTPYIISPEMYSINEAIKLLN